jgi:transcriptional regulator GlxA family with amidase domain
MEDSRATVDMTTDLAVSHPGVARSMRFLWANFHEPIGVEQLAAVAAMSTSAFHRAFISCVGRAPGPELQRARVEQAKRLLRKSREKLSAIANDCGSLAFKKSTRLTPSEYRVESAPSRLVAV